MEEAAGTLRSLHRYLVLASAALILFTWKAGEDEFRYTHTLYQARLVLQQHTYLAAEVSRKISPVYAGRWIDFMKY